MGNSRQDYGDCGAASLGNSCYQTLRRERATFAVRWEGGKKPRTSRAFDGRREHATYMCA